MNCRNWIIPQQHPSMTTDNTIPCWIYRSSRKAEMYIYLTEQDEFDCLPEALRRLLGSLDLVMQLDLHPERKLARVETSAVLDSLAEQGYYIQMPPGRPEYEG